MIRQCTVGPGEWKDGHIKIYRHGAKVFPLGRAGINGEETAIFEETKVAIQDFWQTELPKAEAFVNAKVRYDRGQARDEDMVLLDRFKRPTLMDVLLEIESFQKLL